MTTAELAIVVTGAVGISAPALSVLFESMRERRRAATLRISNDLDELRALLDEIAAAAYEHTVGVISSERRTRDSFFGEPASGSGPDVHKSRRDLYTLNARLVIRLGRDDELVTSFGEFLRLLDQAIRDVGAYYEEHEPFDYSAEQLVVRLGNNRTFEVPLAAPGCVLGPSCSAATRRVLRPRQASTSGTSPCPLISETNH